MRPSNGGRASARRPAGLSSAAPIRPARPGGLNPKAGTNPASFEELQNFTEKGLPEIGKVHFTERHKAGCDIFYGRNGERAYTDVVFGQ